MLLRFNQRKKSGASAPSLPTSPSSSQLSQRVRANMDRFQVLIATNPAAAAYLVEWNEAFLDHVVGPAIKTPKSIG